VTEPTAVIPPPGGAARASRTAVLRLGLLRIGGLIVAIAIIWVVFTLLNGNFLTRLNLLELLRAMSSLGIVALGLTLVIIAGEIDLSLGATYGLVAMAVGTLWIDGTNVVVALLVGIAIGAGIGLANGVLTTITKIPSFIVTLGSMNIVEGLTLWISHAQGINPEYSDPPVPKGQLDFFRSLGSTLLPGQIPIQVAWLVGVAILFVVLLHRSVFGFRLTSIGGNVDAARVMRLPVRRYKIIAFVLAGMLAGLAGILDFSFLGSTDPSAGLPLTFPIFAAVIIGGASLAGGRGTVIGTLSGALLLQSLTNGLAILGVGPFIQLIFVGTVTIGAVALDRLSQRGGT
jgi:ribose/xylose/arabinose/galactoside ABC-type transport system permease subunit